MSQSSSGAAPGQSPSAASNPFVGTFETGRHYKVHKSYIYVAPIVAVFAVVFVTLVNGMQSWVQLAIALQNGDIHVNPLLIIGIILLALAIVIGAFVGLYALAWRNMSYVFDEREFSYYSGIITKRRVHVPYARVQSVNHRASIIQRLFGVCTVTIDSAGGASNRGVRVPYLRLETAERMRVELFMRKAAVAAGAEEAVEYDALADPESDEGARAEAARIARERSQAPEAPMRTAEETRRAYAAAMGLSVPGQQINAREVKAGDDGDALGGYDPDAPDASDAPDSANQVSLQPNALDATFGFAGDFRGLYGGAATFGEEPVTHEYGLSNHELLLTTVSHDTPIAVALTIALAFVVTFAFALLAQDAVATFLSAIAMPITIASAVVTWVIGLIAVLLSYGNFRARRRGSRIEVERGLLTRVSSGIDIDRVQSIEIRQSFIRRLIGYCEVSLGRIDTAGDQSKGNDNSKANAKGLVIHPFVKLDRVDEVIDGLAPELADRPRRVECEPLPKPALRRALLRRCIWYNWALWIAVAVGVCWAVLGAFVDSGAIRFASATSYEQYNAFMAGSLAVVIVACACITIGRGVGAVLWARHSGHAWNRRYLLVHNDGLSTATSVIPRNKIQAAATRTNPFQRRLSLATLQAITAAGTRSTTAKLIDIPAETAAAYLEWAKPSA